MTTAPDRRDSRGSNTDETQTPTAIRAVPIRHYGRWVSAVILFVVAVAFVEAVATSPNMNWDVVAEYFFNPFIMAGLRMTILLTVMCMAIGIVLGVILAVMRQSTNPILSGSAAAYIAVFRGVPALVQLIIWFNIGFLFPQLGVGIPFGPIFFQVEANQLVNALTAALLGLGLNEAAYMAEIARAGILSVEHGQTEAARAFGMTRLQTMRRIILPQAIPVIIPPTGNQTIGMMKNTSLASVVGTFELLQSVQIIYSANYQVIPLLVVASAWYLILTGVLTLGQRYIERTYGQGSADRTERRGGGARSGLRAKLGRARPAGGVQ